MAGQDVWVEPATGHVELDEDLRERYGEYRRRQATRLLRLMPREAVRPLYRRAAAEVIGVGQIEIDDPVALLERYCERLLPLPPFEVWVADVRRAPGAHRDDRAGVDADAPTADRPTTLDEGGLEYGGTEWRALLRGYRDGGVWRGFVAFEDRRGGAGHRTATIFCETGPDALRSRFRSFESAGLTAFLRSALP